MINRNLAALGVALSVASTLLTVTTPVTAQSWALLPTLHDTQFRRNASTHVEFGTSPQCNFQPFVGCFEDVHGVYVAGVHAPTVFSLQGSVRDPGQPVNNSQAATTGIFGALSNQASATVLSTPPLGTPGPHQRVLSSSYSGSAYSDVLTVDAAGLTETLGLVRARVYLSSSFGVSIGGPDIGLAEADSALGRSQFAMNLQDWVAHPGSPTPWSPGAQSTVLFYLSAASARSGPSSTYFWTRDPRDPLHNLTFYDGPFLGGELAFDLLLPITFGRPFSLEAYADLNATAGTAAPSLSPSNPAYSSPGYGSASSAFSMRWGGVTSVSSLNAPRVDGTTADGAALEYTLTALSGTDYSHALQAVPEPPAAVLLALGVFALGGVARRSRSAGRTAGDEGG